MTSFLLADLATLAQYSENQPRDLLVALVAIGLGINIVYAAITENARCFELASVRMLERNVGRSQARYILIGVGSLCLFMGAWLVFQSMGRKSPSRQGAIQSARALVGISTERQ